MSLTSLESTYSVSFDSLRPGVATGSDRKLFKEACRVFRELYAASTDFAYPARFEQGLKRLRSVGEELDPNTLDLVVRQQLEEPRKRLRDQLINRARERYDEMLVDRLDELNHLVLDKLEVEIERQEAAERKTCERWAIPFEPSPALKSMRWTLHEHRNRGHKLRAYYTDEVEASHRCWFPEGL